MATNLIFKKPGVVLQTTKLLRLQTRMGPRAKTWARRLLWLGQPHSMLDRLFSWWMSPMRKEHRHTYLSKRRSISFNFLLAFNICCLPIIFSWWQRHHKCFDAQPTESHKKRRRLWALVPSLRIHLGGIIASWGWESRPLRKLAQSSRLWFYWSFALHRGSSNRFEWNWRGITFLYTIISWGQHSSVWISVWVRQSAPSYPSLRIRIWPDTEARLQHKREHTVVLLQNCQYESRQAVSIQYH